MGVLELNLQNGFESVEVEIRVDGEVVFQKVGVKTKYQIGLADIVKVDLDPGVHEVWVRLMDLDVKTSVSVDTRKTPWLGLNFVDGDLEFTPSVEEFHYL